MRGPDGSNAKSSGNAPRGDDSQRNASANWSDMRRQTKRARAFTLRGARAQVRRRSSETQKEGEVYMCLRDETLDFASDPALDRILVDTRSIRSQSIQDSLLLEKEVRSSSAHSVVRSVSQLLPQSWASRACSHRRFAPLRQRRRISFTRLRILS